MKKFSKVLLVVAILFAASLSTAHADPSDINLTVRDGGAIVFSGTVPLEPAGTINLTDDSGASRSVNADSVLSVLNDADTLSSSFAISDLQYFSSFSSLYLKCITTTTQECDNWQYVVNGAYPSVGMDQNVLSGGENVYIYFGPQDKVMLSASQITTGDALIVTAQKYDYQNDAWTTRTGVTVGLTQPDPSNPYSPKEIQTHAVDGSGQATFTTIPVGSYDVGVQDDYYFPTYPLTVTAAPVGSAPLVTAGSSTTSASTPAATSTQTVTAFSPTQALAYLKSVQASDGSFGGSSLYSDWAAIAFGAMNVTDNSETSLLSYMTAHNSLSSVVTDNERHTMALLALNQNPYLFNGVNYVDAITKSFDGTQFGDVNLINDDIFALIPLANLGYSASDDMINKDVAFMISKQKTDGSFEESADITAAGIQALKSFATITGVSDAISKASGYLTKAQGTDGGFGSVYSTSWALQAMSALSQSWTNSGHGPMDYLALQQVSDGAVLPTTETLQNRIWATSYAIPATLGNTWSTVMHIFPKQVTPAVITPVVAATSVVTPTTTVAKTTTTKKVAAVQTKQPEAVAEVTTPVITETPAVTPDSLTATVANTTPTETNSGTSTPVIVGSVSGVVLILALLKLFVFI